MNTAAISSSEKESNIPLFIALYLTLFLSIASYTITNMMSPYIVGELGGSNEISTYTISFFAIGNAMSIPLGAPLANRFGICRVLVFCLLLFGLFVVISSLATSYPFFIAARFLQGAASGPLYALIFSLFGKVIPKDKADSFTALTITLFAIVPVLSACFGGWIAYDYSWRWGLYILIPCVLILAAFYLKRLKKEDKRISQGPFDWIGFFFYSLAVFSLGFVVITGQQYDWHRSPLIVTFTLIAFLSGIVFLFLEFASKNPLLNLHLLKKPAFSFALFNLALLFSAYFGMIILLSLWLTLDANYTPTWIGLLLGTMVVSGIFPTFLIRERYRLTKIDSRLFLGIAIIFFAISCFHTTIFDVDIDFGRIAFSRAIAGFGLAFFLPPLFRLSFNSFPEEQKVSVMGLFQVVRALSSGLGVAFYTTLWQRRQVFYHDRMGEELTVFSNETKEFFIKAREFGIEGKKAAAKLNYYLDRRSFSLSLDDCFYLMAWIMVGLFVLLLLSFLFKKEEKNKEG